MSKRLSVPIILPSGAVAEDVTVSVSDNGNLLQVEMIWPIPLQNLSLLCKPWIDDPGKNYTLYHPEIVALESALKELRIEQGQTKAEKLSSVDSIQLLFRVDD